MRAQVECEVRCAAQELMVPPRTEWLQGGYLTEETEEGEGRGEGKARQKDGVRRVFKKAMGHFSELKPRSTMAPTVHASKMTDSSNTPVDQLHVQARCKPGEGCWSQREDSWHTTRGEGRT